MCVASAGRVPLNTYLSMWANIIEFTQHGPCCFCVVSNQISDVDSMKAFLDKQTTKSLGVMDGLPGRMLVACPAPVQLVWADREKRDLTIPSLFFLFMVMEELHATPPGCLPIRYQGGSEQDMKFFIEIAERLAPLVACC